MISYLMNSADGQICSEASVDYPECLLKRFAVVFLKRKPTDQAPQTNMQSSLLEYGGMDSAKEKKQLMQVLSLICGTRECHFHRASNSTDDQEHFYELTVTKTESLNIHHSLKSSGMTFSKHDLRAIDTAPC